MIGSDGSPCVLDATIKPRPHTLRTHTHTERGALEDRRRGSRGVQSRSLPLGRSGQQRPLDEPKSPRSRNLWEW